MKQITCFKALFGLIILAGSLLLCTSCMSDEAKLAALAELANKECPMPCEPAGTITAVTFDRDTKTLIYHIKSELGDDFAATEQERELTKQAIQIEFSKEDEDIDQLLGLLIKCNGSMEYVFTNSSGAGNVTIHFSADEIKSMRNHHKTDKELNEEALENFIQITNSQAQDQFEDGVRFKKIYNSDDVVIVYEVDENLYDMASLEAAKDELRKSMFDEVVASPDLKDLVENVLTVDKGIKIQYVGSAGGKGIEFRYSPQELKAGN